MNCDCLKKIEADLKEKLPKQDAEHAGMVIKDVSFDNKALILFGEQSGGINLSIPLTVIHEPMGRKKKTTVSMMAKYCPFCGTPTAKKQNESA